MIKKGIIWGLLGFTVFFVCRLIYGYVVYPNGKPKTSYSQNSYNDQVDFSFSRRNYASVKYKSKGGHSSSATPTAGHDQKYEKVCTMTSQTEKFSQDEKQIHKAIKKHNSLIQYENRSGLKGNRHLNLAIGVPPVNFDSMVVDLKSIGNLKSILIDKQDKTNEFKELQAKRITLDKSLQALKNLKEHSGNIKEFVDLEKQILELEGEIQALGVTLGDFDAENEFCTVKITLSERKERYIEVSLISRIKTALEWTIKFYITFSIAILFMTLAIFLGVKVYDRVKRV